MPVPAYLTVEGKDQGMISDEALTPASVGTLSQATFENAIIIEGFEHLVTIPRDLQTGQPSGQRIHMPVKITKLFDKSSPMLCQALVTGEQLTCTINWFRISSQGALENYFTTTLEEAILLSSRTYMPNCQDPSKKNFTHLQDISIAYKSIKWDHNISNTAGDDSWDLPKV